MKTEGKEFYVARWKDEVDEWGDNDKDFVELPVRKRGGSTAATISMCYKGFLKYTGIKLKPGEVKKIMITAKVIK